MFFVRRWSCPAPEKPWVSSVRFFLGTGFVRFYFHHCVQFPILAMCRGSLMRGRPRKRSRRLKGFRFRLTHCSGYYLQWLKRQRQPQRHLLTSGYSASSRGCLGKRHLLGRPRATPIWTRPGHFSRRRQRGSSPLGSGCHCSCRQHRRLRPRH